MREMDPLLKRRITEGAHLPSREETAPPRALTDAEEAIRQKIGEQTAILGDLLRDNLPDNWERTRAIAAMEGVIQWTYRSLVA